MIRDCEHNIFIDCAIYGKPNSAPDVDYSELLEQTTLNLNGMKTLISRNHFSKEKFWENAQNRKNYQSAKSLLDPKNILPDIYEKFTVGMT